MKFIVTTVLLFACVGYGTAILCYECNSVNNSMCLDPTIYDKESLNKYLRVTECAEGVQSTAEVDERQRGPKEVRATTGMSCAKKTCRPHLLQSPLSSYHRPLYRAGEDSVTRLPIETLNLKPLSQDKEWSPETHVGVEATGVGSLDQGLLASTSSEERAIRRVVGRWGAEWLS
ncbi:hypothetical protein MSG28_013477 [Choristoneura fumiferana]|uniref:Uncharacterized protein n=2 Tax=Choristoneura fumiferana TaxID=7141 RepID=A0ACC0KTK5_CHOFU|nr:hypothetical protein MSG28_013477 [Choristoneura fumiferana]KAI8439807.1 hypothetical protein MSG28_013477 [Choristoneura fumiferana]